MNTFKNRSRAKRELAKDVFFVLIGALIALTMSQIGAVDWLVSKLGGNVVASFVSGIFFTSVFTVAPASVVLAHIAERIPLPTVALWGALGAMCGDLLLFFFIRDRFADDLLNTLKPSLVRHVVNSFHFGFLKWLSPVLGALIIASPLPDEFGLTLLGLSKVRLAVLMPVSFIMNIIGIYGISWFGHIV